MKEFAAEFDPPPFHLDETAGRASVFGGLVASGWHTAAVAMRLLLATGGLPLAYGLIGFGGDITWPQPTRPGDVLQMESEIVAITPSRSKLRQGVVTVRSRMWNQNGEVVYLLTAK